MHCLAIVVVIAFLFVYHGGWNSILALAVLGAISFGDAGRRKRGAGLSRRVARVRG